MRWWSVGRVFSALASTSSYSFSPGRKPVYSISISLPSCRPASSIILFAQSAIFTDLPISKTNIWLPILIVAASITRRQASGIAIKMRVISGSVTVTGSPFAICSRKRSITEPFEPSTFPKRVVTNFVRPLCLPCSIARPRDCT